jgi:hypothetical protein
MSTDGGATATRPPERYDVRVVLDGEEAAALNRLRAYLTARTQGAIAATVSDTIRYALLIADWKVNKQERDTNVE